VLTELDEKGLLDTTLVIWMGEFGRTPKINDQASRDHWPQCYTVLLAGGGVKRGFVYGESDKTASLTHERTRSGRTILRRRFIICSASIPTRRSTARAIGLC